MGKFLTAISDMIIEGRPSAEAPPCVIWLADRYRQPNPYGQGPGNLNALTKNLAGELRQWGEQNLKGQFQVVRVCWRNESFGKRTRKNYGNKSAYSKRFGIRFERETDAVIFKLFWG